MDLLRISAHLKWLVLLGTAAELGAKPATASKEDLAEASASTGEPLPPGDGTCHEHPEYRSIYEGILGLDKHGHRQDTFVDHVVKLVGEQGLTIGSILDVGPGPGHIAHALGEAFAGARLSLVEPNQHFRESVADRLEGMDVVVHPVAFDDFECGNKHDLVVLSHVLYHVAGSRWGQFLDKALGCVSESGLLAVAMLHDSGPYHEFLNRLGSASHSAHGVRKHFEDSGMAYQTEVVPFTLTHNTGSVARDFEAMFETLYFFAVEDALTREEYRRLTVQQSKALEKQIRDFVWQLFDADGGGFSLTIPHQYVTVRRPSVHS